jgi:hypothetical protein
MHIPVVIGLTSFHSPEFQRDDLAQLLATVLDRPDAAGFAIDTVGGEIPIPKSLDAYIKRGETDWIG